MNLELLDAFPIEESKEILDGAKELLKAMRAETLR